MVIVELARVSGFRYGRGEELGFRYSSLGCGRLALIIRTLNRLVAFGLAVQDRSVAGALSGIEFSALGLGGPDSRQDVHGLAGNYRPGLYGSFPK